MPGEPPAQRALMRLRKPAAIVLVTLVLLEAALQLIFPHLPDKVIKTMPQYYDRAGFRTRTAHGAREFPAWKHVDLEVTAQFGDLFSLSCLSLDDALPMAPYRVSYTTDSHGYRNKEPWPDKIELAVVGDSFTAAEAIVSPFWGGISESMLAFGLPGSGTVEQQRLFEAFAHPRQPDTVVLAFFAGNDLVDSRLYAEMRARGELFGDRLQKRKEPGDYLVLQRLWTLLLQEAGKPAASEEPPCAYPQLALTEPPTPVAFWNSFLPMLALSKAELRQSEMFQLALASISDMAAAMEARAGELILMYIPQKAELYWEYLSVDSKRILSEAASAGGLDAAHDKIDQNLFAQRELMRETAAALNIRFLDLTIPLRQAIDGGQQPYFFADTHWNQTGHNIARNALLDMLNGSNLEE